MFTLTDALALVRLELSDTEPTTQRWSDDALQHHLRHALEELSAAAPRQQKSTLHTRANNHPMNIDGLSGRLSIEAVEYPTNTRPPSYTRFSEWADELTLLADTTPGEGEAVNVFWRGLHRLDDAGSTLPSWAERLLAQGAAGHAAREWATLAANQVNVGGSDTWQHYLTLAEERLAAFHAGLARLARRRAPRTARLYTPAEPKPSQSMDRGP